MTTHLEQARFNMIEQQIRPWDVLDLEVLALLSTVKREDFVPLAHKALAFVDMEIPLLGSEEVAMRKGHCMLAPRVEARLLQDLKLTASDRVLEIGAGSGYMAALMAHRSARVITLEIEPQLARMARENLQRAGIANVDVREADGSTAVPAEGPFDVIVLSGSVAEVPHRLLEQLKVGRAAGRDRRHGADDAGHLHHPHRRKQLHHGPALGHGGAAAGPFPRAFAFPFLTN
jgi:protein-L-isoaspartate(D-aspartate) O-methyltransferase